MKIAKNYRLDETLIADIETVCKLQNRSATNLIETVMKEYRMDAGRATWTQQFS